MKSRAIIEEKLLREVKNISEENLKKLLKLVRFFKNEILTEVGKDGSILSLKEKKEIIKNLKGSFKGSLSSIEEFCKRKDIEKELDL